MVGDDIIENKTDKKSCLTCIHQFIINQTKENNECKSCDNHSNFIEDTIPYKDLFFELYNTVEKMDAKNEFYYNYFDGDSTIDNKRDGYSCAINDILLEMKYLIKNEIHKNTIES